RGRRRRERGGGRLRRGGGRSRRGPPQAGAHQLAQQCRAGVSRGRVNSGCRQGARRCVPDRGRGCGARNRPRGRATYFRTVLHQAERGKRARVGRVSGHRSRAWWNDRGSKCASRWSRFSNRAAAEAGHESKLGRSSADQAEGQRRMKETQPTLLVVDDKKNMTRLMAKVMKKDARVCTAENGAEALRVLASQHVDVVLCDLKMPDMDGLDVLRACRRLRPQA